MRTSLTTYLDNNGPKIRGGHARSACPGDDDGPSTLVLLEHLRDQEPDWKKDPRRRCLGNTEAFFANDVTPAKRICLGCPVQRECLEYAVDNGEAGVWGGTSERERRRIRRQREHDAYLKAQARARSGRR